MGIAFISSESLSREMKQPELQIETFNLADAYEMWPLVDADAVKLPYQNLDWLWAWTAHVLPKNARPVIVVGTVGGKIVLLLPLMMIQVFGVTVCRWLGGSVQNVNAGLFDREWLERAQPADMTAILKVVAGRFPEIALFHLERQPKELFGTPNPLAVVGRTIRHCDPLYRATMGDDFEAWEKVRRSRGSRNRLRRRQKHLEAANGTVQVVKARTKDQVAIILAAFLRQREHSRRIGRIPNPFMEKPVQDFVFAAAVSGLSRKEGLHLFALQAGDQIVAVSMALRSGLRHSGFAISMDETYSEFSPGKILERDVLKQQHEAGVREIDFGIGEDSYKMEWTDRTELVDSFIPLSVAGHAAARVLERVTRARGMLKRSTLFRSSLRKFRSTIRRAGVANSAHL
ncbi:GNAT family N-acetyltransferase [Rhodopseudomonas parapalustris]